MKSPEKSGSAIPPRTIKYAMKFNDTISGPNLFGSDCHSVIVQQKAGDTTYFQNIPAAFCHNLQVSMARNIAPDAI